MAPKSGQQIEVEQKQVRTTPNGKEKTKKGKPTDYSSHGVTDNDIFMLPGSDFQLLGFLTVVAAVVRLFRIYQPSSVVFDEVQYACHKIGQQQFNG